MRYAEFIQVVFGLSLLGALYSYVLYPISLVLIGCVRNRPLNRERILPNVTIIICAHNEERWIGEKLDNTLALSYPAEKRQIIVVCDGCSDRTNEIVNSYRDRGINPIELSRQVGKEAAQKTAVSIASGDVLVFTDAATRTDQDALEQLVSNFADASVGCVSSEDRAMSADGHMSGEGLYVRYEMLVRALETRVNSLVGSSGSLFAARREVCADFSDTMSSDFRTVLNTIKLGMRAVSDPRVVGYYRNIRDPKQEFQRKVRTVSRGIYLAFHHLEYFNPLNYGLFSYQLLSHKLMKWMVPVFLIVALLSNALLAWSSDVWLALLWAHGAFYLIGAVGWLCGGEPKLRLAKIPTYFLIANTAIVFAWVKFLRGTIAVRWEPIRRY